MLFPLDTVKTRIQSSQGFLKAGGFRGVYHGVGSVGLGSAPGGETSVSEFISVIKLSLAAAFFVTYEALKARLPAFLPSLLSPAWNHLLSASGAELVRFPE